MPSLKEAEIKRTNLIISIIILINGLVFLNSAYAVYPEEPLSNLTEPASKPYVEGQIIIKLKEDVDFSLQRTQSDKFELLTNEPTLNALNDEFVESADLLITSLRRINETTQEITILSSREKAEEIKQRFPQRTARAPQDADIPELNRNLLLQLKENISVDDVISAYQSNPSIEYARPNYIAKIAVVPNDPYYSSSGSWGQSFDDLYGLHIIDAAESWDINTGAQNIIVAVIDSGLDYNHPDIQGNVWLNQADPINGVDDDNNGYVDDYRGWSFPYNNNDVMDRHGHGSHVSGIIASKGNNVLGVTGIMWNSKIMSIKGFYDNGGGNTAALANAIIYAADNGADVLNNSWVCTEPGLFHDIVLYAYNLGCVVVFAAGNDNANVMYYSPVDMDEEVIVVAATDYNDQRADFSNWGDTIDVSAPGVDILSLRAVAGTYYPTWCAIAGTNYLVLSGTSMACPYVAGLAALLLSYQPNITREMISYFITQSADDIGSPGWDQYTGYGRINAYNALMLASSVIGPLTITNFNAYTVSAASVSLSWSNVNNEDGYKIWRSTTPNNFPGSPIVTLGVNVTSYTNTGLLPNTHYYYKLVAYNWAGSSAPVYDDVVTAGIPAIPQGFIAYSPSLNTMSLGWNNVNYEQGYKIWRSTTPNSFPGSPIATLGANITYYNNTGLSPNTHYYYKLVAYNEAGNSNPAYADAITAQPGTIFVSSTVDNGDLDGVEGADLKCTQLANSSSYVVHGQWRAWVSGPLDRLTFTGTRALVLPDGTSKGMIFNGQGITFSNTNINRDENNNIVSAGTHVWTNTNEGGYSQNGWDCQCWDSSGSGPKGYYGVVGGSGTTWTYSNYTACSGTGRVYCILDTPTPTQPNLKLQVN